MNIKITPKKIITFYFLAPYVLGVLLADGLGIDISGVIKQIFGLLHSIELTGESNNVKAMSLLWIVLLSPFGFLASKSKMDNSNATKVADGDMSNLKILVGSLFCVMTIAVFAYLYVVGLDIVEYLQERQYINPGMRLFLKVCSSDFLFSAFTALIVICEFFAVLIIFRSIKVLWLRFSGFRG